MGLEQGEVSADPTILATFFDESGLLDPSKLNGHLVPAKDYGKEGHPQTFIRKADDGSFEIQVKDGDQVTWKPITRQFASNFVAGELFELRDALQANQW